MTTQQKSNTEVRAKRDALTAKYPDKYVLVVSLANPRANTTAGCTTEVSVGTAAELILAGGHRECTAEEVRAFQEAEAFKRPPSADPLADARRQFGLTKKRGA